jgi:hypothetical protein
MGVDGAAFGRTFPHLFLMTFSNLVPDPLPVETTYVPRIFGFRVHKSARQRQSSATVNATANANANANAANDAVVNANAALNVKGLSNSVHMLPPPANLNGLTNGFAKKEKDEVPETNAALAAPQAAAAGVEEPELGEDDDDDKKQKSKGKRGRKEPEPKNPEVAKGTAAGPTENPVKRRRNNRSS